MSTGNSILNPPSRSADEPIEEIARDERFRLLRLRDERHGAVLAKRPLALPATADDIAALQREYEILRTVASAGVTRALEFVGEPAHCTLLLEDCGLRSLATISAARALSLPAVLDCALQLLDTLEELDRAGIVHRGLTPWSILVQERTGRVLLGDFSVASRNAAEAAVALAPRSYRTRLPYCAPEQFGRVNRSCDRRSDLYALGAVLYELLTGRPPFTTTDPLELIHAHVAKLPVAPADLLGTVPRPVSQIVMRLLAKSGDDRYQGFAALQRDLRQCRRDWAEHGRVADFAIASDDAPAHFAVPLRLYGRSAELRELERTFDACADGAVALLLVAGGAGVGKTALIRGLEERVAARRGDLVFGKFDQLSRDVPYAALVQALRQLMQRALADPPGALAQLRGDLAAALGAHAAVIAELVPELELVLGAQRPPHWLPPAEARNRFTLALQTFVRALATPQRPLVIVLDDLQWSDAATLDLLGPLLAADARHLLLIGAYRDSQAECAALESAVAHLRAEGVATRQVTLPPLDHGTLTELAADTLHVPADANDRPVTELARLLLAKTGGNPFFVIQFLQSLEREGVIAFDARHGRWHCALEAAARAAVTPNVVDLMSRKIDRLAPQARHVLTLAACIGHRFEVQTLAAVIGRAPAATLADLAETVVEGLVVPAADESFSFLHDRVQQAAYARIPEAERPRVHLEVGRQLWARRGQEPHEASAIEASGEGLFDLVSHLNLGAALIEEPDERRAIARLNLGAATRAKSSGAYRAALGYLEAGRTVLRGDWSDHELTFALHLEAAQCAYLCGDFAAAEALLEVLLPHAASALDEARVHSLRMVQFENTARYRDALDCARRGLALFDVTLPQDAQAAQVALDAEIATIDRLIGTRAIAELAALPTMADAPTRMVMSILIDGWSSAYILGEATLARLISALLVRLSLQHGQVAESAYGYVTHAITVGPVRGDYERAYEFGLLALRVNEAFDDRRRRAKICQQFHTHVNLWRRSFASCVPYAQEAWRSGLDNGDFLYAAYGASTEAWPAFAASQDLAQFGRAFEANLELVTRLKTEGFGDALRLMLAWARALQGETRGPRSLSHDGFDEDAYAERYRGHPFFSMFHAIARLQLACLLDDDAAALAAYHAVRPTAQQVVGMIWDPWFAFWGGLALVANWGRASADERAAWRADLYRARDTLDALGANCAENFGCHALLLRAEIARIEGRGLDAIAAYEDAQSCAERFAFAPHQALASELFARFWLERGNRTLAAPLLRAARTAYAQWGAHAKVRALAERHGSLFHEAPRARETAPASLDLATIGKAAHAIAENVELDALLRRMLMIALENAGASRGVFIEVRDDELYVVAEATAADGATILPTIGFGSGPPSCSRALVHYALRTRECLVLNDPARDERFARDEYLARVEPKSVLCLATLHQGRPAAVLYLENRFTPDAFSAERIEVIQLLAAHAAISLASHRLLARMQQEMGERVRAEQALRAIEAGTAAVTGADFFRALVRDLARSLGVRYAFLAECLGAGAGRDPARGRARSRAFWSGDRFGADFEYDLEGTPCALALGTGSYHCAADIQRCFPTDLGLGRLGVESYVGVALHGAAGEIIGHLVIMDARPIADASTALTAMKVSAGRAGAELERVKAEESLHRALAEVGELKNRLQEENVYLRRELIANVSHDLRSPLASLRGYLETLQIKEEALSVEERRSYLAIAARQAEHLQSLISELFELARLDYQGYQLNREPLHVGELARDVVQKFQLAAIAREIDLQIDVTPGVAFVSADTSLIERTLENLIENALAHTPPGGRVCLAVHAHDAQITVAVNDTGSGVPEPDLPHIFERFYRVDKARSRSAKGSGLGLAIVKRIVELHGGEIRVASRVGEGTRFWFTLAAAG